MNNKTYIKNNWEKIYENGNYFYYPDSNFVSLFFKIKKYFFSFNKCLDFGCGSGNNSEFLQLYFQEIYVVDISINALEITKKRLSLKENKYFNTIIQDDMNELDCILAWQSLYYGTFTDFKDKLFKLIKILNKNGIIMFTLLKNNDSKILYSDFINKTDYVINDNIPTQKGCNIFFVDSSIIVKIMNDYGLEIIDYGEFCRNSYKKENSKMSEYYFIGQKK